MNNEELINRIKNQELTEEQINEIQSLLNGQSIERTFLNKAESVLSNLFSSLTPHWTLLLYRFLTLSVIITFIYLLSLREPVNSKEVWTIVGAFIGFIFGQKSSFLRF